MKKFKKFFIIIILLIAVLIGFYAYNSIQKAKEAGKKYRTNRVTRGDMDVIINATGTIKASTQIDIKSEVSGKVIHLFCKRGDNVVKGNPLAEIDAQQYIQTVDSSEASYKSTIAQLDKAEITRDYQVAYSSASIKTKQIARDKARLTYEQSFQQLEETKKLGQAQINQYKALLEQQEKDLNKTLAGSRKQDIAQKKADLDGKEADMEFKRKEYERQKTLYGKDYVSRKDLENAENDYILSKTSYNSAKELYDMTLEGNRPEDIELSRAQVEKAKKDLVAQIEQAKFNIAEKERSVKNAMKDLKEAEANLQQEIVNNMQIGMKEADVKDSQSNLNRAQSQVKKDRDSLSKTKINSPVNGKVISRPINEGDVVASQESTAGGITLMTIADLDEIYAEANIDESDRGKIRLNQKVTITSAAYKGLTFEGLITDISPQAVQVQQIPTFNIKIKISLDNINEKELPDGTKRNELLYPGMSVTAKILVQSKKNILQLPIQSVWQKGDNEYVTVVGINNTLKDVEVKTGIKNLAYIEILTGVSEGDTIKLPDQENK